MDRNGSLHGTSNLFVRRRKIYRAHHDAERRDPRTNRRAIADRRAGATSDTPRDARRAAYGCFSAFFGTRFTVVNRARKRSSSVSRTSAGMRCTSSSSGGNGTSLVSSPAVDAGDLDATGSPRSRASARNADSAASSTSGGPSSIPSGVAVTASSGTVCGSLAAAATCFNAVLRSCGLTGATSRAGFFSAGSAVGCVNIAARRASSASISPFFFRPSPPPARPRGRRVP